MIEIRVDPEQVKTLTDVLHRQAVDFVVIVVVSCAKERVAELAGSLALALNHQGLAVGLVRHPVDEAVVVAGDPGCVALVEVGEG